MTPEEYQTLKAAPLAAAPSPEELACERVREEAGVKHWVAMLKAAAAQPKAFPMPEAPTPHAWAVRKAAEDRRAAAEWHAMPAAERVAHLEAIIVAAADDKERGCVTKARLALLTEAANIRRGVPIVAAERRRFG